MEVTGWLSLLIVGLLWYFWSDRQKTKDTAVNPLTMTDKALRKRYDRDTAWLMKYTTLPYDERQDLDLKATRELKEANTRLIMNELNRRNKEASAQQT